MRARLQQSWWIYVAGALTLLKLWLTRAQPVYGIGPAIHDDRLFAELALHLVRGEWLGPYNQLTLAKGPFYPLFLAGNFWLGLPLGFTQQMLYALACAAMVGALLPWLRRGWDALGLYLLLLWNPMSYEGPSLTRLIRQNLTTPLVLLILAGLVALYLRRHRSFRHQAPWAAAAGLALGAFWLSREDGVWFLPGPALLLTFTAWSLRRVWRTHLAVWSASAALFAAAFSLPVLSVCVLNYRHYGWFGTVEFRADEFQAAYAALARLRQDPVLKPAVVVSRQMREAAYAVSPTFALLRPQFEGPVGDHWADREDFPATERQIKGGWFMWAFRDAVAAAGHARSAREAMAFYQDVANEIDAACAAGRVPAGPPHRGFMPALHVSDLPVLLASAMDYARFFTRFESFEVRSPESSGDYAELLAIREVTRDRLSFAPRDPRPSTPERERSDAFRLDWLDSIGQRLITLLSWLVPLAHVLWTLRLLETAAGRRAGFLLLLASSAWLSALAQLAVNSLVHATSFEYRYPAAMAPSYPLLLLFTGLMLAEAATAWAQRRGAESPSTFTPAYRHPALSWLWAVGAATLVLGVRLREIHLFTGDVAINDQWKIEGADLLLPWLNGTLRPWTFLLPHFEHLPVWTRLLAWSETAVTGRWDPLLQATVNSLAYVAGTMLMIRWLGRELRLLPWMLLTLLVAAIGMFPHGWENSTWGFQSQFPLALLFLYLQADGSFRHAPGTKGWWKAQLAGVAGLFTLASMWMAPLAVVLVAYWTQPRGTRVRLWPLATMGAGLVILAVIRALAPPGGAFAQTAGSPLQFLHALLDLLGWPAGWPGAALLLNLPLLVLALRLYRSAEASAFDRTTLALGLWAWGQAAGLAFARNGDYSGYVSRYGDLLAVGILANGVALARLTPACARWRPLATSYGLAWAFIVGLGLVQLSTSGHAAYFHENAVPHARVRLDAVQAYLTKHDRQQLENPGTRWLLYQDVAQVTSLLDRPDFRALLPHQVNPDTPADLAGTVVRRWQSGWSWTAALGATLWLCAVILLATSRRESTSASPGAASDLTITPVGSRLVPVLGGLALTCGLLLFLWPDPLTFEQSARWRQLIRAPGVVGELQYSFAQPGPLPDSRLVGAAPLSPPELRNLFIGTAPEGPALTGTMLSTRFTLTAPYLVVPYFGYPISHGNGLRIRIEEADGRVITEIGCEGPNRTDIGFWMAEVGHHIGKFARLVLYDGRTETEAWVAAATPIATASPMLAPQLAERYRLEKLAPAHLALLRIAVFSLSLLTVILLVRAFRRSNRRG